MGCPGSDKAMTKKWRPAPGGGQCPKSWCCSQKDVAKMDSGMKCRIKCGNKGSAYNGYFQCMDKCLGRKR
jgi:hypothetical protein